MNNPTDYFRNFTTDDQGRRIFIGLTFEETAEVDAYDEKDMTTRRTNVSAWATLEERDRDTDRYLELWEKHERARAELFAEVTLMPQIGPNGRIR